MASTYPLGYDDERFESIVDQNFYCLICYNVLKDPLMCRRNQHYFCSGCITEHLRTNSHTCPTCGDELTVEKLQDVPRIVKNYLNERKIRCDHYDRGCRELVQLQNLQRHVAECGFTPVVCGNQGCGETISKRDRTYHESELCQFRKLKCHNCGETSTMITGMETKIANIDTKMANINTEMKNMNTKMAHRDTKLKNVETKIANIDTKTANTDRKLEIMNTKMANLQANVEAKFEAVNNEVRGMRMSLNEVKDGFDHLKEAVLEKIESKERKQEEITRDVRGTASKERKQEEITRDVSGTASGGRENQHIFVAGGAARNSVEIFNYRQRLWSLLKPMPDNRDSGTSFVYNNHLTVAGGYCGSRVGFVDNMIRMNIHPVPDLSINWSDFAAKLPSRMFDHSGVVYKNSLFVTGGYNAHQGVYSDCIHEVQLQPPYTVKLLSKMPEPRMRHNTVLCDDSILIVGGKKSAYCKDNLSSVLSYEIKTNECQQLPALSYAVSEMATVKWAENVVIIGGVDKDEEVLNNVMIYNMKTGNSHTLPPMLHKRKRCMAVVIENTIVVLGGRDERWNDLKSVEGFNFERFSWQELPDMNETRWLATAVVI